MKLLGRALELERYIRLLDGGGTGVVVAGPAGVGRSRLAEAFVDVARSRGFSTARVAGSQATRSVPLGALASLVGTTERAALELLARPEALLEPLGDNPRRALLVDDAHLLDDLSAALIERVAAQGLAHVIVTVRSDAPAPDAIAQLWRNDTLVRLEVQALDQTSTDALAEAVLGGPVEPASRRRLTTLSGGSPLTLKELIAVAREDGALQADAGVWRLTGELPLSRRLLDLVGARWGMVSDEERDALEVVALGQPLGLASLEWLLPSPIVTALERRGLLAVDRCQRRLEVRIADPLLAEVLRRQTPASRARAVSAVLLDDLQAAGGRRRDDVVRRARLAAEAGRALPAEDFFAGAEIARRDGDLELAERLIRSAVSAGAGCDAVLLDAELAWLEGETERAEASLAALSTEATDNATRARVACLRIENLMSMGRRGEALSVAAAAEGVLEDDALKADVIAARAGVLLEGGELAAAFAVVEPLAVSPDGPVPNASGILSACLARMGRPVEALAVGIQGQASASNSTVPHASPERHWVTRAQALIHSGRIQNARQLLGREHARATAQGNAAAQAALALALAEADLLTGDASHAVQLCRDAAALYAAKRWPHRQRVAMIGLAHALAVAGQVAEAHRVLDDVRSVLPQAPDGGAARALLRAQAWIAVAEGDLVGARSSLAEAATLAQAAGDAVAEFDCLSDMVRLGYAAAVVDRLTQLSDGAAAALISVGARYAVALRKNDANGLEQASTAFERMGTPLFAAEAASEAAKAWRQLGEPRRAALLEPRAAGLAQQCEAAATPALQSSACRAVLTARQLEIATLAATGMANRDIAERLYLSVRTVETQLQRAYEKLGIDGRSKLAAALATSA